MENLISIDEVIKEAKELGVDFGRGTPYNRLRYYTKMGWLPNMKRKKSGEKGAAEGHYPEEVLQRLVLIQQLREDGYSNDEITAELEKEEKLSGLRTLINTPEARTRLIVYSSFALLVFLIISELGLLPFANSKANLIIQTTQSTPNTLLDSGTAYVPSGRSRVFVKSKFVHTNSRIYVTFSDNYSPASRYWVSEKDSLNGFYVSLDAPTSSDAEFSWWVSD